MVKGLWWMGQKKSDNGNRVGFWKLILIYKNVCEVNQPFAVFWI